MANTEPKARIDLRLPVAQKELFERAAILGGYRNLTDFMLAELQKDAEKVVEEKNKLVLNQNDAKIFFDALDNPPAPTTYALEAVQLFNAYLAAEE
jgi:uncharacterized protein (DUF1778 family)